MGTESFIYMKGGISARSRFRKFMCSPSHTHKHELHYNYHMCELNYS
jgi:hypothetical protein